MRVTFISGAYPPIHDGVGDYVMNLTRHFPINTEFTVITSVGVKRTDQIWPEVTHWGFKSWRAITRATKLSRPDVLHFEYSTRPYGRKIAVNLLPFWLRLRFPRTPLVVTIHEFGDASMLGRIRAAVTALGGSHVIAVNAESADGLSRYLLGRRVQEIGIGTGIEPDWISAPEAQQLLTRFGLLNRRYAMYFGFVDSTKGIERLLDSIKGWPTDLMLAIVTEYDSNNPYHIQISQRINSSGLGERVIWTGFLPVREISTLLHEAFLCVLPFDAPATMRRSSLIAALVHGLPTITTGPIPLPLVSNSNVLTITSKDPDELARVVTDLSQAEQLRKILKVNSLKLAVCFDWNEIVRRHLALYQESLTGK